MYMKSYRMVVRDGGGDPLELFAEMASDLRVTDFARQRMSADARIREIEIWSGQTRLCRVLGRDADVPASAIQFRVVAEDALLVEGNAARRG